MNGRAEPERTASEGATQAGVPEVRFGGRRFWTAALEPDDSLLSLQSGFLRHYFRLAQAERRLVGMVRQERAGGRAIRQVELERQRLGRDLHTGVGQILAAIRLQIEVIETQLPEPPSAVRQALERISRLAHDALQQVRALSRRLHPPEWQRLTLEAALAELWSASGIPEKFQASLTVDPLPRQPSLECTILMYRAAQEALSNIAEHARPTRVAASLEARGDELILTVSDDGAGFDAAALLAAPASIASGIGLRSIREQAAGLGGRLDIESGSHGTTLRLTAPCASDSA